MWIFVWIKLSGHSLSVWDKFDDWIDSSNFSVLGYLPLIQKDSITHMHGLAVYVKQRPPFALDLYLEISTDSYICFRLALLHSLSCFFFLYQSPTPSLCTVFDSISSNIVEVLSINQYANVLKTDKPNMVKLIDLVN